MSDHSSRQHAGTGAPSDVSEVPEPSYAERARSLVHIARVGSLSTLSQKRLGWPFGSVMPYGVDKLGRLLFLISTMAMHTQNISGDSRASLLITQPNSSDDPLGAARVTLMGNISKLCKEEVAEARDLYLARHESAKYWVDFKDFAFYRMDMLDVYYVGGFGVMGWVTSDEYTQSEPDPLADSESKIIQHMNADHTASLVLLARSFAGIDADEAVMASVDRLGFQLRLKAGDRVHGARVSFTRAVMSAEEARTVLIEMVQHAKQHL